MKSQDLWSPLSLFLDGPHRMRWAQSMVERQLTRDELGWIVSESLKTTSEVAQSLLLDALNSEL